MVKFDNRKFLKIRKIKKYSQAKVAEDAETTIRYVRDLETGRKFNPSAAMLYQLSRALGVTMESLMTNDENE